MICGSLSLSILHRPRSHLLSFFLFSIRSAGFPTLNFHPAGFRSMPSGFVLIWLYHTEKTIKNKRTIIRCLVAFLWCFGIKRPENPSGCRNISANRCNSPVFGCYSLILRLFEKALILLKRKQKLLILRLIQGICCNQYASRIYKW